MFVKIEKDEKVFDFSLALKEFSADFLLLIPLLKAAFRIYSVPSASQTSNSDNE